MTTSDAALPVGYVARLPAPGDAEVLYELVAACSIAEWGTVGITREEVRSSLATTVADLDADALVIGAADGRLVARAVLRLRGGGQFWISSDVHPEHRGRGLGTYLLLWAEAHLNVKEAEPPERSVRARQQIAAADELARTLVEHHGYVAVRRSRRMLIEMSAAPETPVWPAGVGVRTFVTDQDEGAVYEASEEAFADHFEHVREDLAEYAAYFQSEAFDPSLTFLAVEGEEIAGVALCQSREERDEETAAALGWIESLSVRRPYRRRGVALALLRHVFGEFHRCGVSRVALFVDAESETGAVELYHAAGMRPFREWIEYEKLIQGFTDGAQP